MRRFADVQMILNRLHIFFKILPFNIDLVVKKTFGLSLLDSYIFA